MDTRTLSTFLGNLLITVVEELLNVGRAPVAVCGSGRGIRGRIDAGSRRMDGYLGRNLGRNSKDAVVCSVIRLHLNVGAVPLHPATKSHI